MSNKKGGKGAVASTTESIYLDNLLKEGSKRIAEKNPRFNFSSRVYFRSTKTTQLSLFGSMENPSISDMGTIEYIIPDGGAFYVGGKLLAVFEAKKQGSRGNAIERWYKNNIWCRSFLNKDVSYVTFCSGFVEEKGPLYRILYPFHNGSLGSVNSFTKGKNSAFFKEKWTPEEVANIMQGILDEIMELV